MEVRARQRSNAPSPTEVRLPGSAREVIVVYRKAYIPMLVKVSGRVMEVRARQRANEYSPIEVKPSGSVTEVSPEPLNARRPMWVRVFGSVSEVRDVRPWHAESAISSIPAGTTARRRGTCIVMSLGHVQGDLVVSGPTIAC